MAAGVRLMDNTAFLDLASPRLAICSLQETECATPNYPRVLYPEDTVETYTITQAGAKQFISCGLNSAMVYASSTPIPDLSFDIDLGVTAVNFQLADITFADLTFKDVALEFAGENFCTASLTGCVVRLDFQWSFLQTSWPYLFDSGNGSLFLDNVGMRVIAGSSCNYDTCPGHLEVLLQRADLSFDAIRISLEGGSSWIYQSMIDIVLAAIEDSISEVISNILISSIQVLMEQQMFGKSYNLAYLAHAPVSKDERIISPWVVGMGYLTVKFSGYIYETANLTDEYIKPDMLNNVTFNYNNNDMSFTIHKAGFENIFYIFHKYHNLYSVPGVYEVLDVPKIEFMHVAALVSMNVSTPDGNFDVKMKGDVKTRTITITSEINTHQNVTYLYFEYEAYSCTQTSGTSGDCDALSKKVVAHMNEVAKDSGYQFNQTPFMDVDTFTTIIDVGQNVIRLTGNNPDECPSL